MISMLTAALLSAPFTFDPAVPSHDLPSLSAMQDESVVADEQPVPGLGQVERLSRGTRISVDANYAYLFKSTVDDDQGEFDLNRLRLRLAGRTVVSEGWELTYGFKYQFDGFSFDGTGDFGDTPAVWTDIHTMQFNIGSMFAITDKWNAFVGGQFRFSRETGADWGDSFMGGGAFGASYTFSENLTLGGGLGMETQLEESLLYYPIVIVNWRFAERWSINTRITSGWADSTGVQLVYDWTDTLQLAVAGNYDYQRFRLNDEGPAADGVGHFTAMPVYFRLTWSPTHSVRVSGVVGLNVSGELKAKSSNGRTYAKHDYGAGLLAGAQLSITF